MPANILKNEKFHSINANYEGPTLDQLKQDLLVQVLDLPAILARGSNDHLIEYDDKTLLVKWKKELLEEMPIGNLRMIKILLENKIELQQKTY